MNAITTLFGRSMMRQTVLWALMTFLALAVVVELIDFLELFRRSTGRVRLEGRIIAFLVLLRAPDLLLSVAPFTILLACSGLFYRLSVTQELLSMRNAGVSIWGILTPVLLVVLLFGLLEMTALNPLASAMREKFEHLERDYLRKERSELFITKTGFWFRRDLTGRDLTGLQEEASSLPAGGSYVLHGATMSDGGATLQKASLFVFHPNATFQAHLQGARAHLEDGQWVFYDGYRQIDDGTRSTFQRYRTGIGMTEENLRKSLAGPSTLSVWELPAFIKRIEGFGFDSLVYRMRFHSVFAKPVLYCVLVGIAAVFMARATRRVRRLTMFLGAIITGFGLYVFQQLFLVLGHSGFLSPITAAWIPPLTGAMLGISALLHVEDG